MTVLPVRALQAVRPAASPGVIAAAAVVAATFAATPFLLPEISAELDVDLGATGLLSTAQVGSFALATFFAGRLFKPRRRLHYGALILVATATIGSGLTSDFTVMLLTRLVAGLGLGTLIWIAWADATRFAKGIGDVAAVGPLTAAVAAPILGWLIEFGSYNAVFMGLAVLALAATALPVDFGDLPRVGKRVSPSRSNRILLVALGLMSLGGSSVFVFTGATAASVHGLAPVQVSWAFSINAVTGVIATRLAARRGTSWLWILATALAALAVGTVESPLVFYMALALWGLAFWMAVPAVLKLITERSYSPSERMGDAQASMAIGRVFGPVLGAFTLGSAMFAQLSIVGASVMVLAGLVVGSVEVYRRSAPPLQIDR